MLNRFKELVMKKKTLTTKQDMKIRKLYDEGYGIHVIVNKLNYKLTADEIEHSIIRTAQARKDTQPIR
jgi:hypothetical protein